MCAFDRSLNGGTSESEPHQMPPSLDSLSAAQLMEPILAYLNGGREDLFSLAYDCAGQLTMRDQMEAQSNPARSADAERALALLTLEQRRKLGVTLD